MIFNKLYKLFNKKQNNPESKDKEIDKSACPKQEKCNNPSCNLGKNNQHYNCLLFKQFKRDDHNLMKKE